MAVKIFRNDDEGYVRELEGSARYVGNFAGRRTACLIHLSDCYRLNVWGNKVERTRNPKAVSSTLEELKSWVETNHPGGIIVCQWCFCI